MHGNSSSGPRRICKPVPQTTAPAPRRDDLPDAPDIDEEIDMAATRPNSSEMYAMHRGPAAAVPQQERQLQAFNADEISKLIARSNQPLYLQHTTASAYVGTPPAAAVDPRRRHGERRRLRAGRLPRGLGCHLENPDALGTSCDLRPPLPRGALRPARP